jgi:NhaP-type Na+/H+ or K+/H+ antiporter
MLGFSGVITLFCCGFTMSYYAFQNLSQKSKISSTLAIETIGHAAEAFVFTYLGLGIYGMEQEKFSSVFMISVLFSCIAARAVGVFLPSLFVGVCRYFDMRINMKQLLIIWFSGSIRGAIAFALSLQINPSISPNSGLLVSSTLVVVLVTTLLFGGLMSIFTKFIGIKEETTNQSQLDYSNLIDNQATTSQ